MQQIYDKAKAIKLLLLDVDGVLTDGSIYITDQGDEFKTFNARDGIGMRALLKHGVEIGIISGRRCEAVEHRMRDIGVKYVYQKQTDKMLAFKELTAKLQLSFKHIAYVGDDIPDLEIMQQCGLKITVADAYPLIKEAADWVTTQPGGRGAVREVCDLIIQAQ
jgi:3-deoxy-D-manno-octulosonate 8-phosphate phosphatase (KDO 8-P phosphatase)